MHPLSSLCVLHNDGSNDVIVMHARVLFSICGDVAMYNLIIILVQIHIHVRIYTRQ